MSYYCTECCIKHFEEENEYWSHMSAKTFIDKEFPPGHWIWNPEWNDNHHLSTDLKGKDE